MHPSHRTTPGDPQQQGIALILALIFSILLYILVAELVVSARLLRVTGENDALLARMRNQMEYTLAEIEDTLLSDIAGEPEGQEGGALGAFGAPGAPSMPTGLGGEGGEGGEGEEEQQDPTAVCDSSRDSWAQPQSRAENDLTTYFWVEPENAKLNLLSLWSADEEWARFSRDQLVRLLDRLREDTEYDLGVSDADLIVRQIEEFARRTGTDRMPKPPLKTEDEKVRELALPLHLDDLLLLPEVTEDLYFDKVLDGRVLRGLSSVLTVWTSLQLDPGDPEKIAARAARTGQSPDRAADADPAAAGGAPAAATPADPNAPPPPPLGEGIRVNLNFASRPVLRALMPPEKIPDRVIDAIVRWRAEVDPEAEEGEGAVDAYDFGELQLGDEPKKRFFATVEDLEQLPEFAELPDPEAKTEFQNLLTTKSDVFSIHLATMFRRNEENRVYVLRRARSLVVRRDDGAEGKLYPLIRFEERHGLRVKPADDQDDPDNRLLDLNLQYSEMDMFAQEDRAWNPFLVDFYLPKWQRDQLLNR
ncbi:MAG: hypothetical protein AB7O97_03990 [Planctomycetota bacterium]